MLVVALVICVPVVGRTGATGETVLETSVDEDDEVEVELLLLVVSVDDEVVGVEAAVGAVDTVEEDTKVVVD